ncbi:hypothetical protein TIFTF001_009429 [Ficus carica]|uniref:phosphopyruvate hydratase n=1 Tax=Ficus carica TaxID=3494 RepID=A0AA87ZUM5_FICCA|nr:hypothetical protein TIFTF001_009429 [Ficus carica]
MTKIIEEQLASECENSKLWKCKQKLFRNAIFAASFAVCKAGAAVEKLHLFRHIANLAGYKDVMLPIPAYNIMKAHSHPTNKLAVQEYILLPVGAHSMMDAMSMNF